MKAGETFTVESNTCPYCHCKYRDGDYHSPDGCEVKFVVAGQPLMNDDGVSIPIEQP